MGNGPLLVALGTRTDQNMGSMLDASGKFRKLFLYRIRAGSLKAANWALGVKQEAVTKFKSETES